MIEGLSRSRTAPDYYPYMDALMEKYPRCPFCGRNWSDSSVCGGANISAADGLRSLFVNRHKCSTCDRNTTLDREQCYECARNARPGNRHRVTVKACLRCGSLYETQHPERQRFCSVSCGNSARFSK